MHGFVHGFWRRGLALAVLASLLVGVPPQVQAQAQAGQGSNLQSTPAYRHFLRKIRRGKFVRVAFLGGSITAGATTRPLVDPDGAYDYSSYDREADCWRGQVMRHLRAEHQTFPKQIKMVNAALSGTGSLVGAFRYETDVARHNPDLLIIEFSVNDAPLAAISTTPTADCSIQRSLLSIIRQARANNPDVALLIAISPTRDMFQAGNESTAMARAITKDAAIAFGVPYVDVVDMFYNRQLPNGLTRTDLYDGPPALNGNSEHPAPAGHAVYAKAVNEVLDGLFRLRAFRFDPIRIPIPQSLKAFPRQPVELAPEDMPSAPGFSPATNLENWDRHPIFNGKQAMFAQETKSDMSFEFSGGAAAIWWEWDYNDQPIHGRMKILLDGQDLGVFSTDPDFSAGEQRIPRFHVIGEGLDPSVTHQVQILIPKTQPQVLPNTLNLAMIGFYADQG